MVCATSKASDQNLCLSPNHTTLMEISCYSSFVFYAKMTMNIVIVLSNPENYVLKVSKGAKIRNQYNQVPQLTQDTNGKVTNSQIDTTNESQEVSPFSAGDHKAHINRRAHKDIANTRQKKTLKIHKRSTALKRLPMKSIQEHLRQLLQTVSPSKMLAIPLCLDALFGHFKQSSNKPSQRCQSRCYIAPPKFN